MAVLCIVCDKTFSTQTNLNKHTKRVHKSKPKIRSYDQSKWNYKCLEGGCYSSFCRNTDLINHLSEDHHIKMQSEIMTFANKEDFLAWKHLIEKKDKSNYIMARSSHQGNGKLIRYYMCNRSGKKLSNSNNVRRCKRQGSCKLNRSCTSSIRVVEGNDLVVTWYRTHYGHSIDLEHIRISKIDRSVVASKRELEVAPSRIEIDMTDFNPKSRTKEILQSSELDEIQQHTEYVNKSDILREDFSAEIMTTMTKLQNADKYKLTDEVILQIKSHLVTVQNLLEQSSTFDNSMPLSQMSDIKPEKKTILKQQRFFSTQKKKNGRKIICKKAATSDLKDIEKNFKCNVTELYISHTSMEDHNYILVVE